MFNDEDVDIDERTEDSEWTISLNNSELKLDLVKYGSVFKDAKSTYQAVMYEPDENASTGFTWGDIDVPSVVTNIDQFLTWGMYTLRKEAARRYINVLSPQEQEMVFNVMNEMIDEDFKSHTTLSDDEDFAAHEYEV